MGTAKKKKTGEKSIIVPTSSISVSGRSINILCNLPGIAEEEIRIDLEGTQLIISAPMQNATVERKITVPEGSSIRKKKFREGILKIIVERPL